MRAVTINFVETPISRFLSNIIQKVLILIYQLIQFFLSKLGLLVRCAFFFKLWKFNRNGKKLLGKVEVCIAYYLAHEKRIRQNINLFMVKLIQYFYIFLSLTFSIPSLSIDVSLHLLRHRPVEVFKVFVCVNPPNLALVSTKLHFDETISLAGVVV